VQSAKRSKKKESIEHGTMLGEGERKSSKKQKEFAHQLALEGFGAREAFSQSVFPFQRSP
jgi:hypothetical protein